MRWKKVLILLLITFSAIADFIVIGDVRKTISFERLNYSEQFRRTIPFINLLEPEAVIIVGDLVYGYAHEDEKERLLEEWKAFLNEMRKIKAPVLLVPGNHEIFGESWAEEFYRKYGSPLYYSKVIGDRLFIVLNSEEVGREETIAGEQLEFLKKTLEKYKNLTKKFVFLHKPLWEEEYESGGWNRFVHPLLVEYGVNAVFAGHFHSYRFEERDGVKYFVTGGGGAEITFQEGLGDFFHFILVREKGQKLEYIPLKSDAYFKPEALTYEFFKKIQEYHYEIVPHFKAERGIKATKKEMVVKNIFPVKLHYEIKMISQNRWIKINPHKIEFSLDPGEEFVLPVVLKTSIKKEKDVFPLPEISVETRKQGSGSLFFHLQNSLKLENPWLLKKACATIPVKFLTGYSYSTAMPKEFYEDYPEKVVKNLMKGKGCIPVTVDYDGYFNLKKQLYPTIGVYNYFFFKILSPSDKKALLVIDTGNPYKVWVNGELVCTRDVKLRRTTACRYISIELHKGENPVLLMIVEHSGSWRMKVTVASLENDLTFSY